MHMHMHTYTTATPSASCVRELTGHAMIGSIDSANRGGSASTSGDSVNRLPRLFPAAAQPDVVRASQKDELYLHHLTDACHDAVRCLLGPRRALLWNRETAVAAQILYYGITTGAGVQTLGEEYCDILQVTGTVGLPPSIMRRGLLVLLETVMPYLADRAGGTTVSPLHSGPWTSHSDHFSSASPNFAASGEGLVQQQPWAPQFSQLQQSVVATWRMVWQVLSSYSGPAVRMHLAFFYFFGLYYHWSKRVTGVRYLFIGKLFEHRPSYHLLGVLLFIQLGITSASWAVGNFMQFRLLSGNAAKHAAEVQEASGPNIHREQKAVVLEDGSSRLAAPTSIRLSEAGEALAHKKCPLCLSVRHHPTATPCGHVFCWHCIAEWGNQKPECPLCRSPFTQSSLVCVQHTDFH